LEKGKPPFPLSDKFLSFIHLQGLDEWESLFFANKFLYQDVLKEISSEDIVLDIGAGNLSLSILLAKKVKAVYAIEVNPMIIANALEDIGYNLPVNLYVTCGNALKLEFPKNVSAAILLMRHCLHFKEYFAKLKQTNCKKLITNARWKSGFEVIDLDAPRIPFSALKEGWYACDCGAVGYKGEGNFPDSMPVEVFGCPQCYSK
jgi:SAM-dependent methyltransferase